MLDEEGDIQCAWNRIILPEIIMTRAYLGQLATVVGKKIFGGSGLMEAVEAFGGKRVLVSVYA